MTPRLYLAALLLSVIVINGQIGAQAADADVPRKGGDVVEVEIAKGVKMKFCWVPAGGIALN